MVKLLVLGGSGFVGRALCREGVRRGWSVSSLSRGGAPPTTDSLLAKVQWHRGSALDPTTYPPILAGHDHVVHSIGTLFESNPFYNLYKQQPVSYEASYRALIRDTAETAADAAAQAGVKTFAYISAASLGALDNAVLPAYMAMKREAEQLLLAHDEFRTVIVRPGFMYGTDRWLTIPMSAGISVMTLFTAGMLPRALCVDTVARATLNELASADVKSTILEPSDIARKGAL